MNIIDGLTFDDVLLKPKNSKIHSRSGIDLSVDLGKGILLKGPFISANMKTVTGPDMARAMVDYGMGILHRFSSIEDQIKNYKEVGTATVGVSVGISSERENDTLIDETGTKIVCIDVAHGDHERVIKETNRLSKKYPHILLIVGNIATRTGMLSLGDAGADVIKVGVGGGSLCTTRIETGNGVPQLTALENAFTTFEDHFSNPRPRIIADGGIKSGGDCVKALCFSDAVMLGSMLAGTDESPGQIIKIDGMQYKNYAGSSTHKTNRIEGVSGLIPYKGSVKNILEVLKEGVQSGLSYQGCDNLIDLKESPEFVRISSAGLKESHPHANLK